MYNPYVNFGSNFPSPPVNLTAPGFPMANRMPNSQTGRSNILGVNGEAGANAYITGPYEEVALFDTTRDYVYIKKADSSGYAPLRKFKMVEETKNVVLNENDFVTRKEFDELKGEIVEYGKQYIREQTSNTKQQHNSDVGGVQKIQTVNEWQKSSCDSGEYDSTR